MSDPVTIGFLAAQALALAAPEVLKTTVSEATKDAYKKLKELVAHWAGAEVAALEAAPASKGKQLAVAELIDERPEDQREILRAAVEALQAHLNTDAPTIGLAIRTLIDSELKLRKVNVERGTGAAIETATRTRIEIDELSVGKPPGK